MWVVTRYDDVLAVVKDPATFSSAGAVSSSSLPFSPAVMKVLEHGILHMAVLTASDPPLHSRLRRLVSRAFTPRRIGLLEPRVVAIADELVDSFEDEGGADIIARFGWPLPLLVIGEMLGLDQDELDRVHEWSRDWLLLLQRAGDEADQVERARGVVAMQRYVSALLRERLHVPGDDLLSALLTDASAGEAPLTNEEVVGLVFTLMVAGHLTVTRAVGSGLMLLFQNPRTRAELQADPARVAPFVEELLRLESPAQGLFRVTTRETILGGRRLPPGSRLMVHYGSANRDTHHFVDPDSLDLHRAESEQHLAFGWGIHFCLGAPLARLELGIALLRLLVRLPALRLDPVRAPERDPIFFARGFTRLFVAWDPPSAPGASAS